MSAVMERDERSGLYLPQHRGVIRDLRGATKVWGDDVLRSFVPPISGGDSFLTGTSAEVLYSSIATGTQLNTFTTEDNLMKTLPPVIIPAGFFYNAAATGKSLKIKAVGRLGTTGSPTFTFTVRLLTSTTWSAGGIVLGTTGAVTAGATKTLSPWFLDLEVIFRTLASGGASTIAAMGEVRGPSSLASPFAFTMPADNTAFTTTTFDNSLTNYLFISAACGTSNALNLIQLEMLKVYGEN